MPEYSTWTRSWGLVLYKGCIGDKKAVRPPEGGPTEVGSPSASNVPLVSIPHPKRMPDGPAKRPGRLGRFSFFYWLGQIVWPRLDEARPRLFSWAVWHSCRMGARNQEQTRGRIGPQLRLGNLRVGELHFCPLCTALDQASSLSR